MSDRMKQNDFYVIIRQNDKNHSFLSVIGGSANLSHRQALAVCEDMNRFFAAYQFLMFATISTRDEE